MCSSDLSRVFLPKLGWLRYRNSQDVVGTAKNMTVSSRNDKWFVSIQIEREVEQPVAQGDAVGIDMGVIRFATAHELSPMILSMHKGCWDGRLSSVTGRGASVQRVCRWLA